ncbi:hypothetical protein CLOM_g19363 [Closterium sp. NIES-68]|nr:hypothetical protein CLOM_g19363 [Closterium sp. NIES-68]GJP76861.1 hypothetical protein CLOP_g7311 [Closterium sp. NIES-67]
MLTFLTSSGSFRRPLMGALRAFASGAGCCHGLSRAPAPSPTPRSSLLPALLTLSSSPITHTSPCLPARAALTPSWSRGLVSPSAFFQCAQSRGFVRTFPQGLKAPDGSRKVAGSNPASDHGKRLAARAGGAGASAEGGGEEGTGEVSGKVPGICPGCGVTMQSDDPKLPGFFVLPAALDPAKSAEVPGLGDDEGIEEAEWEDLEGLAEEEEEEGAGRKKTAMWTEFDLKSRGSPGKLVEAKLPVDEVDDADVESGFEEFDADNYLDADLAAEASRKSGRKGVNDDNEDDDEDEEEDELFDEEAWAKAWEKQLGRNGAEELIKGDFRGKGARGERGGDWMRGGVVEGEEEEAEEEEGQMKDGKLVVCARCHALRNYGQVKDESVENLLPDFDFERAVGQRLRAAYGRRAVVLVVVDAADFDGSFPRRAAELLARAEAEAAGKWKESQADGKAAGPPGGSNTFRLILAANKADLLPPQISPLRLEQWIRRRAKAGGLPRLTSLHLLSAKTGFGVGHLAGQLAALAGPRGDVWVVGAQNAGKSSLINALAAAVKGAGKGGKGGGKAGQGAGGKRSKKGGGGGGGGVGGVGLTEAWVPGTTIGVVPIEGVLGGRARVMDTPGLLHPHQLSVRLTRDELKVVVPKKALKPRTFRIKPGQCVLMGGLARVDVEQAAAESIYLTAWLSPMIACHMGKIETAPAVLEKHVGDKLQPPAQASRMGELGVWLPRSVTVEGTRWDQSSTDVAIAGLGWVGVGIKGTAKLKVWTFEGVGVTVREAMVFDYATVFERPGFSTGGLPVTREDGAKGSGGGGAVSGGTDGKKKKKKVRGGSNRSRPDEVDAVVL